MQSNICYPIISDKYEIFPDIYIFNMPKLATAIALNSISCSMYINGNISQSIHNIQVKFGMCIHKAIYYNFNRRTDFSNGLEAYIII